MTLPVDGARSNFFGRGGIFGTVPFFVSLTLVQTDGPSSQLYDYVRR